MFGDRFVWDDEKTARNLKKHRVSFDEATGVFDDPLEVTLKDVDHSREELRYTAIGSGQRSDTLLVVGIRGLVYIPGTVALRLADDVAKHFHNAQQVNDALRQLIAEGRVPTS